MKQLKGQGFIRLSGKARGSLYLELDYEEAQQFLQQYKARIIIDFGGGHSYHRAVQTRKDGYARIAMSKRVLKEIGAAEGDQVSFIIKPDESTYGMNFPEAFAEVLEQDEEAKKEFNTLKPGKQRGLLHYIASAKSIETQVKRALDVAEKMKTQSLYGQKNYRKKTE